MELTSYKLEHFKPALPLGAMADKKLPPVVVDPLKVIYFDDIDELDQWKVSPRVKVICVHGKVPGEVKKPDDSRSQWLFEVACAFCRAGVPEEVQFSVFTNPVHKVSESVLGDRNPERYALRQIENATKRAADPDLFDMNQKHVAVSMKGKFRVLTWRRDHMYPSQRVPEFSSYADFCRLNDHPRVDIPAVGRRAARSISKGQNWVDNPLHECADGIDFHPGLPQIIERGGGRYINTYSGFSVEPIAGDCSLYFAHVRDNICSGDLALYEYVLSNMASGVQHPEDPQRVSLSLRGIPGCGKGVFAIEYGKIFGRHFLHLTDPAHINGKFNAHSAEALFEVADETLNLNDPMNEAKMKTHISERTRMIELKGIDAFQAKVFSRTWFLTNYEHPLTIEGNDRRYLSIYVSAARALDKPYFIAICDQMANGGREALLHFLLDRDISNFNAEDIPQTKELQLQKLLSASPGDQAIISFAQEGNLPGALNDFVETDQHKHRPWIARSRSIGGSKGLFDGMRERGGGGLRTASEPSLSVVLKKWGFTSHPLGKRTGWAAPLLEHLRRDIATAYPGIEWHHLDIVSWGGLTNAMIERRKRKAAGEKQNCEDQGDLDDDEAPF